MDKNPLKILLVEDDEDDAFFIKDLLQEGLGHKPALDHTLFVQDAFSFLDKQDYQICLLDFRLGEVDGIDFLRNVRSKKIRTPIILLTGQGDQEIAVEAMKAGATDYIPKSRLTPDSLTHSIRYAIGLHQEGERRRQAEEELIKSHRKLTITHKELQESMSQLKKAQNQILRSEKLASVGRLSACVCHEILNPLNIISGHAQALLMERDNDESLTEDLNSIMEEIHRIEKIVASLLKFSRLGDEMLKPGIINKELDSVIAMLEKDMKLNGIKIVKQFDDGLPIIHIDTDRIRQVFLNIINNANYAMAEGGVLTITTEALNQKTMALSSLSMNNNLDGILRIKFSDTGPGIRKEDCEKIFDPFFTTKPEEKGTGLGLTVCYSIIENLGGTLEVESEPGQGATFIIDLPVRRPSEESSLAETLQSISTHPFRQNQIHQE